MGDRNAKPSTWDPKAESWIPASEMDARNARLKSKHQTNADSPNSHEDEDENENDDENDDIFDADGMPGKRRKTNSGTHERVFEAKKWVQIPAAIAEKLPEPKYLADRRPGMESLYGGAYKATNGFGVLGPNIGAGSGAVGYDLGDGSGLGNASGVLGNNAAPAPESTPVRKNMPPKRKKKKLGGPGRKKANPHPSDPTALATESGDVTTTDTPTGENEESANADTNMGDAQNGEPEGSGSDSEGEGSEEGEVEEGPRAEAEAPATQLDAGVEPEPAPGAVPEPEPKPAMEMGAVVGPEPTVEEQIAPEMATASVEAAAPVTTTTTTTTTGEVDLLGDLEAAVDKEQESA